MTPFPQPAPRARSGTSIFFDSVSPGRTPVIDAIGQDAGTGRGARLLCRACGAAITDEGQRRSVGGSHSHTRSNPAGLRFTFGCFSRAPGCRCLGAATADHTWFPGCRWRIAACGACGEHLGWAFTGADTFHGLILTRLVGEKEA